MASNPVRIEVQILLTHGQKVDITALRCGTTTLRLQSNLLSAFSQAATAFLVVTEPARQLKEVGKVSDPFIHSINKYKQCR